MRYAIVYYSEHGQTQKISQFLKRCLAYGSGLRDVVHLIDVRDESQHVDLIGRVDHVIIGAPVYFGRFPRKLISWVDHNRAALARKPVSIFVVGMTFETRFTGSGPAGNLLVRRFARSLKLSPNFATVIAGAFDYSRYGILTRFFAKLIGRSLGAPAPATKRFELTDWRDVEIYSEAIRKADPSSPFYVGQSPALKQPEI